VAASAPERTLKSGAVGFPTALATAVGLIMASPVILTAQSGFSIGGDAFAIAIVIALMMMLAQATTFAEAASILPTAGSVYDYVACGLGRACAIMGTLSAYILVHAFAGTAETILSGIMFVVNFESLDARLASSGLSWTIGVGLVMLFGTLNAFGIKAYSRAELVLTFGMWTSLIVFGLIGLFSPPLVTLHGWFGASSIGVDWRAILSLVGMAMFMFVGMEFVTPLAVELRNPSRVIPRAMFLGLAAVAVCMVIYGAAITRQVQNVATNAAGTVHLLETPAAIPQFAERVLGSAGRIWLGFAFLFAGAATINTLMAVLPRILYGMALDGALPRAFAYLHPKSKAPLLGIAVSVAIPCLHAWLIRGDLDSIMHLVLAAVCAWGFAYLLVNLSVIVLRIRRPDLPRPYKSPWFPLPQILSSAGIVLAMWYIAPPGIEPRSVYVPFGIMLGLTAIYAIVWTVFVQRVHPFEPVLVETVLANELDRSRRSDH
jgi:amino acid transporter